MDIYCQHKPRRTRRNCATWEILGEALRGRKKSMGEGVCRFFEENGRGITEGKDIANGFCNFYCKVGPDLAGKIPAVQDRDFKSYLGEKVKEDLIWRPTTPAEIEHLCRGLESGKGMGWDGVSPKVIKAVATELAGSLSRLYNCCMREGYYPPCFKVA